MRRLVAADHGVELAVARRLGEVARVFLQRIVAALGGGTVGGPALAQRCDRFFERLRLYIALGQCVGGVGALGQHQRHQHALDGDKAVARLVGDGFGLVEQARRLRCHHDLARARAFDLRLLGESGFHGVMNGTRIAARRADQVGREALGIVEQDFQDMVGKKTLVTFAQGQHLGTLQETAHTLGVFLLVHHLTLSFHAPSKCDD